MCTIQHRPSLFFFSFFFFLCNGKAWLGSVAGETWNNAGKTSTADESGALEIILNVNCSVKLGSEYCLAVDFIRVLNDIKPFFFNEP
jgi:hypothetical protein